LEVAVAAAPDQALVWEAASLAVEVEARVLAAAQVDLEAPGAEEARAVRAAQVAAQLTLEICGVRPGKEVAEGAEERPE
jgi:hypothetical protein